MKVEVNAKYYVYMLHNTLQWHNQGQAGRICPTPSGILLQDPESVCKFINGKCLLNFVSMATQQSKQIGTSYSKVIKLE